MVHPGAVVVIPLLDDGRVLLERQFRYPIGRVMTEFPAGKLDPGEDPPGLRQARAAGGNRLYRRAMGHAGALHLAIAYSTEIIPSSSRAACARRGSWTRTSSWT